MNQIYQKPPETQEKFKKAFFQEESLPVIELYLAHGYRKGLCKFLRYILGIANLCDSVYPTHDTIAREADMTPRQVLRLSKEAERLGFIHIENRRVTGKQRAHFNKLGFALNPVGQTSNLYVVNPLLFNLDIRKRLEKYIISLWFFPLAILMPTMSNTMMDSTFVWEKINMEASSERTVAGTRKKCQGDCPLLEIFDLETHTNNHSAARGAYSEPLSAGGKPVYKENAMNNDSVHKNQQREEAREFAQFDNQPTATKDGLSFQERRSLKREDINGSRLKEFGTEEYGRVIQYAPRSKMYIGSWPNGHRRCVYRAKDGCFYATLLEASRAERDLREASDDDTEVL